MTKQPDIRDLWIAQRLEQSAQGVANMRAEAERIIANSRKSIRPLLRATLDECQADYDEERRDGWAIDYEDGR